MSSFFCQRIPPPGAQGKAVRIQAGAGFRMRRYTQNEGAEFGVRKISAPLKSGRKEMGQDGKIIPFRVRNDFLIGLRRPLLR